MNAPETFRARFRFRLLKTLDIKAHEHRFKIGEHDVVLSPPVPDLAIRESEWLIMNARGFASELDARTFANRLKTASEVSSIASRVGIDSGLDLATAGFGQRVKDHLRETSGLSVRDNIHGVDVFHDDPNTRIVNISATASVSKNPESFLADLTLFHHTTEHLSQKSKDMVLLLNYALLRPEPVAQIVFAFSAVEMLGQGEAWSPNQVRLLDDLATRAENSDLGTARERHEVSAALKKATHKLTLRQGVLRLLAALDLDDLKQEWDRLYSERSKLVHGLAPRPGADYGQLASNTVSLCGRILLKAISTELAQVDRHVDTYYKSLVEE